MSGNNNFPHDGEHGRSCTGYGCDCDEKNYGHYSGGSHGCGGCGAGFIWLAAVVIGTLIGAVCGEVFGAIVLVVVGFILLMNR